MAIVDRSSKEKSRRKSFVFEEGGGKIMLRLRVNGEIREVATEGSTTLLEVLREDMGLTGTKHGCELGECGTCAVLLDGEPVLSCLLLGVEAEDAALRAAIADEVERAIFAGESAPKPHPESALDDVYA